MGVSPSLPVPVLWRDMMKTLYLSKGYVAVVSNRDYARCMRGNKWYAKEIRNSRGVLLAIYAQRHVTINGKDTNESLHRFILGVADQTTQVDHKDGNGLNNRRRNLRKAT